VKDILYDRELMAIPFNGNNYAILINVKILSQLRCLHRLLLLASIGEFFFGIPARESFLIIVQYNFLYGILSG
jgi:hypothetical protein